LFDLVLEEVLVGPETKCMSAYFVLHELSLGMVFVAYLTELHVSLLLFFFHNFFLLNHVLLARNELFFELVF
jgi:hypothetical protein